MRPWITLFGLSALTIGLAGCASSPEPAASQRPNPAAVFCGEQGSEYRLENGQCVLPDGRTVDAWEYYRRQHGE